MKPQAHRRTPKRITLKKHETLMAVKDSEIDQLRKRIEDLENYSKAVWETANTNRDKQLKAEKYARRDRPIVNAIIGYEEE